MSQFFLVSGAKPQLVGLPGLRIVDLAGAEALIQRGARSLFSAASRAQCWFVVDEQECPDVLFTEAQRELQSDVAFQETRICKLFEQILPIAEKIALWYSDEWDDLPVVTDAAAFLRGLESALHTDTAECWLLFERRTS